MVAYVLNGSHCFEVLELSYGVDPLQKNPIYVCGLNIIYGLVINELWAGS